MTTASQANESSWCFTCSENKPCSDYVRDHKIKVIFAGVDGKKEQITRRCRECGNILGINAQAPPKDLIIIEPYFDK
jgi:hypothetical protein